jgi:hypothetical protein
MLIFLTLFFAQVCTLCQNKVLHVEALNTNLRGGESHTLP